MFGAFLRWWKGTPRARTAVTPAPEPVDWSPFELYLSEIRRGLPLVDIDARVRRGWWGRGALWESAAEEVLAQPDVAVEVVGLFSMHPYGYVREEAVRRLDAFSSGAELPFLVLRLTDWVWQVRSAAWAAVERRMRPEHAAPVVREFALFDRAMRARRGDASAIADALAKVLATDEGRAAMRAAPDPVMARFVVRHVPRAIDDVVDSVLFDVNPGLRMLALPVIAKRPDALPLLQRLARDSFPPVRREALVTLARLSPDETRPLVEAALTDRSAIVRHAASVLLGGDTAARYRGALATAATPRNLAAAIAGLAEWGNAADAGTLAGYLTHERASVRRAAVKGVMRLAGDRYAERVLPMLHDASRGVSAAVRDALRPCAGAIGLGPLLEHYRGATEPHVRQNLVSLFAGLLKWDAAAGLLTAAAEDDPALAARAVAFIRTWNRDYNRTHTPPSRRQIEDVVAALDRAAPRLDEQLVRSLRFTLEPLTGRQ